MRLQLWIYKEALRTSSSRASTCFHLSDGLKRKKANGEENAHHSRMFIEVLYHRCIWCL
jgi:hypothetical protein